MNVVVTGAAGLLGRRLIDALLTRDGLTDSRGQFHRIEQIKAFDVISSPATDDRRVQSISGDISADGVLDGLIDEKTTSVFHLAAILSGQSETEFDVGMKVNFNAARTILERMRHLGTGAKFVTTSSVAVFGGSLPETVDDAQVWAPQSSYGTAKAMVDLLLADYSRREFVDGRSLRMPTIVVRPGKPNRAASSFASSIIREPINSIDAVCPVASETILWLMSPERAIENLIHGHELSAEQLTRGRVINMPGLSISVRAMMEALSRVAGKEVAQRVSFESDPAVERIVNSWPGNFSAAYARKLGFTFDVDFDSVIRAFIEHNLASAKPASQRNT